MDLNERIKSAINEKLCKKGEAYHKRRMAAGEKSSAYLIFTPYILPCSV